MANDLVNLNEYRRRKSNRELRTTIMSALGMDEQPEWQAEVANWILLWHQRLPAVATLNQTEYNFLLTMLYWQGLPTERQARWLEAIERRTAAMLEQNSSA